MEEQFHPNEDLDPGDEWEKGISASINLLIQKDKEQLEPLR